MKDSIFQIFKMLFKGIYDLLAELFNAIVKPGTNNRNSDAEFMSQGEILSSFNKGVCPNGYQFLTVKDSWTSAIALGASGQGKSSCVAIPTIYNLIKNGHNIIINDSNFELAPATCGYAHQNNYKHFYILFDDPKKSSGWNPLKRANNVTEIQKVASAFVRSELGDNQRDPFWGNMATLLISLLIRLVKKQDEKYANMANVKHLLDNLVNPEALDVLIVSTKDRELISEWKQFVVLDRKLMTSITSTCRSALAIFSIPSVQQVTSVDTIDLESFREGRNILYILNRSGDATFYNSLLTIFFEQSFASTMQKIPKKDEKSVFYVIDEAGVLPIKSLHLAVSQLRKYFSGVLLLGQDFSQFVHMYGAQQAETIKNNCFLRIYFPSQPLQTCQELERILGTVRTETKNGFRSKPLMEVSEIRSMLPNTSLILTGSNRAIYSEMRPYYKNPILNSYSKIPMPDMKSGLPHLEIPLIPIPKAQKVYDKANQK